MTSWGKGGLKMAIFAYGDGDGDGDGDGERECV